MNSNLCVGLSFCFGIFLENKAVGFVALSEYVPRRKNKRRILHFNRVVIHPDYCGMNLSVICQNHIAEQFLRKGYRIMAKGSNIAAHIAKQRDDNWILRDSGYKTPLPGVLMKRKVCFRQWVQWKTFEYVGDVNYWKRKI